MKIYIFVLFSIFASARCSLLEMSQVLWARLLAGGLTKSGQLDPLRVPVVKVDQSEGNTSYRIVLRNVEITGLNHSTVESVHVARGRLESNLSDFEAGYVSYSDLRDLDSIRYRFHTLVKEPKPRNETRRSGQGTGQPGPSEDRADPRNPFQTFSDNLNSEARDDVDLVYAQNYKLFEKLTPNDQRRHEFSTATDQRREDNGGIKCFGSCVRNRNPSASFADKRRPGDSDRNRGDRKYGEFREQEESDTHGSASENFDQKQTSFARVEQPEEMIRSTPESRNNRKYVSRISHPAGTREAGVKSGAYQRQDETGRRGSLNLYESRTEAGKNRSQVNYQTPPGYVDIIYADNDDQRIRHFGGSRRREDENMKIYGLEDIRKDLEQHNRYVIHNFTASEALQKRNNMTRVAAESKRIKDLVRYAENFQEKQGYFEQGMQLVYHFGGMDELTPDETDQKPESNEAKRRKREHNKNDTEDDIMHVIVRIKVPLLKVKADYLLTGKVGREILRGNGLLNGNFTELIGDFTLELKKVGSTTLTVRAARARLVADHRKVTLQGMNEKGPVEAVLVHGLMAAEAVAAMIADDLATKALSENPTTDAMIYKMYSNNPAELTK